MSESEVDAVAAVVVISDPSARGQDQFLWGDRLMVSVGNLVAWIFPILMLAIVSQVLMRKAGHNQAWLDDMQWWMYGFAVLTAFGYATTTESHVRVDIFHQGFSVRKKAIIEVFAIGWFLLPFIGIMTDILMNYSLASLEAREGSDSPNGLHKLYLLKLSLPILFTLIGIAAWSVMKRHASTLTQPNTWKLLLFAAPFTWFAFERLAHYGLYWYLKFANPDVASRLLNKDPLLQNSTWIGFAVLMACVVIAYLKRQKHSQD